MKPPNSLCWGVRDKGAIGNSIAAKEEAGRWAAWGLMALVGCLGLGRSCGGWWEGAGLVLVLAADSAAG